MALSFVGSSIGNANNGGAISLTLPGGIATNDVVYATEGIPNSGQPDLDVTISSSGYTELADLFGDDNGETNMGIYRKVMGGTPDSTVEFPAQGTADSGNAAACHVWRGADTTTPEDVAISTATGGNTAIANPPSIDWSTSGVVTLAMGANVHQSGPTVAASGPTGYENTAEDTGNDGVDSTVAISSKSDPSDPEDPGVFSYANLTDNAAYSWCAATIAIRPAAGGAEVSYVMFSPRMDGIGRGGIFPGNRVQ